MAVSRLPVGANPPALEFPYFPTPQQAVVWRNWGIIPLKNLAETLGTTEDNILQLAAGMGLPVPPQIEACWLTRGYTTIIRNNWHLLPYDQLLTLLGWPAEKLAFTLKEDDFLWVKLGRLKPAVKPAHYCPLSPEQAIHTAAIKKSIAEHFPLLGRPDPIPPFDFLRRFREPEKKEKKAARPAGNDQIKLDSSWTIKVPDLPGRIMVFARGFMAALEERWDVTLRLSRRKSDAPAIVLNIKPDASLLPESHIITISPQIIQINAVDEVGCLRGLQWLESQMEAAGGPYLRSGAIVHKTRFDFRCLYPYFALYGEPLLDEELVRIPRGYFADLSRSGINGIWLQALLYTLTPLDKAPELSNTSARRLDFLRRLTESAADYGIGIYLYLNEPRCMPLAFFKEYPEWKGVEEDDCACLCTSQPQVQNYLRQSTARLFQEVPELAGVFTITASENATSCWSHGRGDQCPRCRERPPAEVIAEVNRLIAEGVHSVKPQARVIVWTWGWLQEWRERIIALLPDNIELMTNSEEDLPTEVGGVKGRVADYSMSQIGPGERARSAWRWARSRGLRASAKVQVNTTWECPAIPYLPVMNLVETHLKRLTEEGVSGLMLSWTLGGYPSLNLKLASRYFWAEDPPAADVLGQLAAHEFGLGAQAGVVRAWGHFSEAFREFPFSLGVIMYGCHNPGPMNLLYAKPTGYRATMVGFPYDDLPTWRSIYPGYLFQEQLEKLSLGWQKGLDALAAAGKAVDADKQAVFTAMEQVATGAYLHFRSAYLQTVYIRLRDYLDVTIGNKERSRIVACIIKVLEEEIELAKRLHDRVRIDSTIGFEATNQYAYTVQNLREKVLNCEYLVRVFQAQAANPLPVDDRRLELPDKTYFVTDPNGIGEQSGFARLAFDDSDWPEVGAKIFWNDLCPMESPISNADNPLLKYSGQAWYRFHVRIPSAWRGGKIVLHIDRIDDIDRTYLNGRLVGQTGKDVPDYYRIPRDYPLPDELIRYDRDNVIAVNVDDFGGTAGMAGRSYLSVVFDR